MNLKFRDEIDFATFDNLMEDDALPSSFVRFKMSL
jgi:hypothetical protein